MAEFKNKEEYEKRKADSDQNEKSKRGQNPKQGIKKSIAKVGLLILGSIFFGVIFLLLGTNYNKNRNEYIDDSQEIYFYVTKSDESPEIIKQKVRFPILAEDTVIEASLKRDFKDFRGVTIKRFDEVLWDRSYYDLNGNKLWLYAYPIGSILNLLSTFFLLVFPFLYLLVRFVAWAIRTLREKPAAQV